MSEERFERDLRIALRGLAPSHAHDRLRRRVAAIPHEAHAQRAVTVVWGRAEGLAVAAIAAVLVLALVSRVPAVGPHGLPSPTSSAIPTGVPVNLDPTQYVADPRFQTCLQDDLVLSSVADALYAFELPRASDYRAHLRIGYYGPLATSDQPALVVVARTGYPPLLHIPPFFGQSIPPTPEPTPPPGVRAVCVGITGQTTRLGLGNVADADIVLPPAEAPVGEPLATRFTLLDHSLGDIFAMTWDQQSKALWLVTDRPRLVRVTSDGQTTAWGLPSGPSLQPEPKIGGGLIQPLIPAADYFFDRVDLVVDSKGAVWIAAGYGLVRFDPATGTSQLMVFPSDPTTLEGEQGHWLSAIAADGDGVLVARHGIAQLMRVSAAMTDTGSTALPGDFLNVGGLAVSGSRLYVVSPPKLLVLDRAGVPVASGSASVLPRSMRPAPDGRAATLPTIDVGDTGVLIGPDGTTQSLVVPFETVASAEPDFHQNDGRVLVATDWVGHTWYAEREGGGEILIVDATPTP